MTNLPNAPQLTSILAQPVASVSDSAIIDIAKAAGIRPEDVHSIAAKLAEPPRLSIVTDAATSDDQLGFQPMVRALSHIVLSPNSETPLAVAVDGPWGSGKSSILKMVEKQARLVGFNVIWLNAWALEDAGRMIPEFSAAVLEEIRRAGGTLSSQIGLVLANAVAALVPNALGGNTLRALVGARTADAAAKGAEQEVSTFVRSRTQISELVRALFEQQKSQHRSENARPRLLVMIDDLDRAVPEQIAAILRNLKLLLETEGCIFLLAMDVGLVGKGIEDFYRANYAKQPPGETDEVTTIVPGYGRSYLEKLVQIKLPVPLLVRERVLDCVRGFGFAEEVVEIVRWAPDQDILNPRRLKRYLNWLSVTLQLVMSARPHGVFDNAFALRAIALRRDWRRIYDELVADPQALPRQIWPQDTASLQMAREFRDYLAPLVTPDDSPRDDSDMPWRSRLHHFNASLEAARSIPPDDGDLPSDGIYFEMFDRRITVKDWVRPVDREGDLFWVEQKTEGRLRCHFPVRSLYKGRIYVSDLPVSPNRARPSRLVSLSIDGRQESGMPIVKGELRLPVHAVIEPGATCVFAQELHYWTQGSGENSYTALRQTRRARLTIRNELLDDVDLVVAICRLGSEDYEEIRIPFGTEVEVCDVADVDPDARAFDFRLRLA